MIAMVGLGQEECGSQKIKQHTVKPSILHIDGSYVNEMIVTFHYFISYKPIIVFTIKINLF